MDILSIVWVNDKRMTLRNDDDFTLLRNICIFDEIDEIEELEDLKSVEQHVVVPFVKVVEDDVEKMETLINREIDTDDDDEYKQKYYMNETKKCIRQIRKVAPIINDGYIPFPVREEAKKCFDFLMLKFFVLRRKRTGARIPVYCYCNLSKHFEPHLVINNEKPIFN